MYISVLFSLQNVMLQMGLNVISVEGMRIRQLRTYGLQCKACFKLVETAIVDMCNLDWILLILVSCSCHTLNRARHISSLCIL